MVWSQYKQLSTAYQLRGLTPSLLFDIKDVR